MPKRKKEFEDDLYADYDDWDEHDWYADDDDFYGHSSRRKKSLWAGGLLLLLAGLAALRLLLALGNSKQHPVITKYVAASDPGAPTATLSTARQAPYTHTPHQPTPSAQPATATTAPTPTGQAFDPAPLQEQMLDLINRDREANGLNPVEWDEVAALAGQRHAAEMLEFGYFSHWNREGLGPEHRYTLAGGVHAVRENLHTYWYTYEDGRGAPIEDWAAVIENAQEGLMNSPGHRANILDPAHTHVGIGMAYDPTAGQFRLAQEFSNQYTQLSQALPLQASLGQSIVVQGRVQGNDLSNLLLDLAYEPFPEPLDIATLNQTGTYTSSASSVDTRRIDPGFDETVILDYNQQAGFYHLRLFVDTSTGQALVLDHSIEVR